MSQRLPPPESYAVGCERVRCLCALFDCSCSSNVRTELHNVQVGGAPLSKHQIKYGGSGWDLVPDRMDERRKVANAARTLGFWVQVEPDHVHCQSLAPGAGAPY